MQLTRGIHRQILEAALDSSSHFAIRRRRQTSILPRRPLVKYPLED